MSTEGAAEWRAGRIANKQAKQNLRLSDPEVQQKSQLYATQLKGLYDKLPSLPKDSQEYSDTVNAMQSTLGEVRELLHPDNAPGALAKYGHLITDALKITNPQDRIKSAANKREKASEGDERQAKLLASSAPLSPEQVATQNAEAANAGSLTSIQGKMKNLKTLFPDAPKEQMDKWGMELVQSAMQIKPTQEKYFTQLATTKDADGKEHYWRVPMSADENPQEVDFNGQTMVPKNAKPMKYAKGDLVRVKPGQSPTGWVRLLYDPSDPSKRKFIPATPSRFYMGTESSDVTTDPFGVTSTTSRTTKPMSQAVVDLTGMTMVSPEEYTPDKAEGESFTPAAQQPITPPTPASPQHSRAAVNPHANSPVAPPRAGNEQPRVQTPESTGGAQTRPNPYGSQYPPLNADYHIPDTAKVNPYLREAANQLLDGVDIKEIHVPSRDEKAAEAIARQYGWGRGPYTPRELKQMQNANQFLDAVLRSKPFMKALDEGVYQRSKMAEAEKDASKGSLFGTVFHQLAVKNLAPEQQEYLRLRAAMLGTVSGLSSVVRSGRPTEATINRLANEIPTVLASANSKDAKERIKNIKKELNLALEQGVPRPNAPKQQGNSGASNTGGLSSGDVDADSLRKKMLQHVGGK